MCPVDLSNLKLVEEEIELTDDASYVEATDYPPPPPEGTYTLIQGKPTFAATQGGALSASMDQTIAEGEHRDQKIMFDRVSDKAFERGGVKVSMMQDHIRSVYATGAPERSARTRAERASAVEAAEGKAFKAVVKWEGYCGHKDTPQEVANSKDGVVIKGERNFPGGQDVACRVCGKAIRPRARIDRRISA